MMQRRLVLLTGLASASIALAACVDETSTYRYRMTVEVDTPEGHKSSSGVIEVETNIVRPGSHPAGYAVTHDVRGEAVTVDLGSRGVLFALLRSEDDPDFAGKVMFLLAPRGQVGTDDFLIRFENMLQMSEPVDLPATRGAIATRVGINPMVDHLKARPMLVTFGDLDVPSSVKRVDPDDLATTFGEGVSLKSISVQMTDDAVTTGIEDRLEWLPSWAERDRSGDQYPRDVPVGDFPALFKKDGW